MNDKLKKINNTISFFETEQEKYVVIGNMEMYGGSFIKALSAALMMADHANVLKIKEAFPEYWERYLNFK